MKIQSIRAVPYTIPLKSALRWGKTHELATLKHVLIFAELDDGSIGIGEATPRPTIYGETPESVMAIVQNDYAPRLIGQWCGDMKCLAGLDDKIADIKNNNTARGALNIALWSAYAASQQKTLSHYLNATSTQTQLSFILGTGNDADVLQEVSDVYQAGIRVLKVKVGKEPNRELALMQAIQQQYPDMHLYADANECLTPTSAKQVLRQLADMGVLYCEEPLPIYKVKARQILRQRQFLPIIADDSCFTEPDLIRELALNTFDVLNIKTARTGFSQSRQMLKRALRRGKRIMIGSQASSLLGCLHTIIFACQAGIDCPTEGSFFLKTAAEYPVSLPIENGYVQRDAAEKALPGLINDLLNTQA
jgi:L-alanine-DL-glutamate epimerase-like enolase superfamily enzyme